MPILPTCSADSSALRRARSSIWLRRSAPQRHAERDDKNQAHDAEMAQQTEFAPSIAHSACIGGGAKAL